MSTSSRNRNLIIIIVALLLTNIAVLAYFLWFKKPEPAKQGGGPGSGFLVKKLKEEVGFNADQVAKYEVLKNEQWATIQPMFDQMRKAKDSLFRLLSNPGVSDSIVVKATDLIAQNQKALDLQTFNHFKKIRELCTVEQQPKYDSLVQRMFRRMGKPQHKQDGNKDKEEKK